MVVEQNLKILRPGVELPVLTFLTALLSEILNYLDPKDLGIVSCVSTAFYRLVSEHQAWKDFFLKKWGVGKAWWPRVSGA